MKNRILLSCPDASLPQKERIKALEDTIAVWIRSEALNELVRLFGGNVPEGSLKEQIEYCNGFSEVWNYRKKKANGGERWLVQEDEFIKEHSEAIMEYMGCLGLTGITEPCCKPDYVLPLGGARMSNLDRCLAAEEVCRQYPDEAVSVIALTGMRPINEIERPFLAHYAPEAQTEYDAVCGGIEKAFHLPEDAGTEEVHFNENINLSWAERHYDNAPRMIHVLSAPSTDSERRANSMDTFRFFLEKYQPKPESKMLLVTSCVYVPFQLMKFMDLALENDFYVECIGNRDYAHSPAVLNAASYLQELKAAINAVHALAEKYF